MMSAEIADTRKDSFHGWSESRSFCAVLQSRFTSRVLIRFTIASYSVLCQPAALCSPAD